MSWFLLTPISGFISRRLRQLPHYHRNSYWPFDCWKWKFSFPVAFLLCSRSYCIIRRAPANCIDMSNHLVTILWTTSSALILGTYFDQEAPIVLSSIYSRTFLLCYPKSNRDLLVLPCLWFVRLFGQLLRLLLHLPLQSHFRKQSIKNPKSH